MSINAYFLPIFFMKLQLLYSIGILVAMFIIQAYCAIKLTQCGLVTKSLFFTDIVAKCMDLKSCKLSMVIISLFQIVIGTFQLILLICSLSFLIEKEAVQAIALGICFAVIIVSVCIKLLYKHSIITTILTIIIFVCFIIFLII